MNTTLTVEDPLIGQEVTIVVTLPAGDEPRDERPVLVSLGVAGQPPIIKTGTFAEAPSLINEAWTAFGVRAQLAGAVPTEPETETADEELVATAAVPEEAPPAAEKAAGREPVPVLGGASMTTQTNIPTRRVFKYGQQTFPDPGSEYSTEQVLNHLRAFFPELGHARVEEKTLADGTLEITFSKQVTRKG